MATHRTLARWHSWSAAAAMACSLVLSAQGCGYRVVRSDALFGHSQIALVPFGEDTPTGISPALSEEFARLLAAGGVRLGHDAKSADAVLTGQLTYQRTSPAPTGGSVTAYSVWVTVQAKLQSNTGRALWNKTVSGKEDFLAPSGSGNNALGAEARRREALTRLANQLARELYDNLVLISAASQEASPS